jgi:hypothetical protein
MLAGFKSKVRSRLSGFLAASEKVGPGRVQPLAVAALEIFTFLFRGRNRHFHVLDFRIFFGDLAFGR